MAELTVRQVALVQMMRKSPAHEARGFALIAESEQPADFLDELSNANLLDPSANLGPRVVEGRPGYSFVPVWPATIYLASLARLAGKSGNVELGARVLAIVRAVTAYEEDGTKTDNYHTWTAFAEILAAVPPACVEAADIEAAGVWLRTKADNAMIVRALDAAIKGLLASGVRSEQEHAVQLFEQCTALRTASEPSRPLRTLEPVAESFWLEELLKRHAAALGRIAGQRVLDSLCGRLRDLFGEAFIADRTWLHRPAIEDHEQNKPEDVTDAFVAATRESLLAWLDSEPADATVYIAALWRDGAQIVRRLAIHVSRTRPELLREVIVENLPAALSDIGHIHELYGLLRDGYSTFGAHLRSQVRDAITQLADDAAVDPADRPFVLRKQRDWLHAIIQQGDAIADAQYARLAADVGPTVEHPDFLSYHSSWEGSGPSPYTIAELTAFARARQLEERLQGWVPPADERQGSRRSLVDALSAAVEADPDPFWYLLAAEICLGRGFQYGLVEGGRRYLISDRAAAQPDVAQRALASLLPFLQALLANPEFWAEASDSAGRFEPDKDWIPPAAARLADELPSIHTLALPIPVLDGLIEVARLAMEHGAGIEMTDDPMNAAINNVRGTALQAMLNNALRRCRDMEEQSGRHDGAWAPVRPYVQIELDGCVGGERLEASAIFGASLDYLAYIDEAWLVANMGKIFPLQSTNNFLFALGGLAFVRFRQSFYSLLRTHDIPRTGLGLRELRGHARERLIGRVAAAYLWSQEELDSPCVADMFAPAREEDLIELLHTTGRWSREKLPDDQVERLKALASRCADFARAGAPNGARLLAEVSRFVRFVDRPDPEAKQWLLASARSAHLSSWESEFLEKIADFAEHDPSSAAELLRAFLEYERVPTDYGGHMKEAVRRIFSAGLQSEALAIINGLVVLGGGPEWTQVYNDLIDGVSNTAST